MIKTLLKLVIAALVLHASWRAGTTYWRFYTFKDRVQETAQFAGNKSSEALHERVLEIAEQMDVPLSPDRVDVRRRENHTLIDAEYIESIEIVPTYFYPWEFKVNVDAFTTR